MVWIDLALGYAWWVRIYLTVELYFQDLFSLQGYLNIMAVENVFGYDTTILHKFEYYTVRLGSMALDDFMDQFFVYITEFMYMAGYVMAILFEFDFGMYLSSPWVRSYPKDLSLFHLCRCSHSCMDFVLWDLVGPGFLGSFYGLEEISLLIAEAFSCFAFISVEVSLVAMCGLDLPCRWCINR